MAGLSSILASLVVEEPRVSRCVRAAFPLRREPAALSTQDRSEGRPLERRFECCSHLTRLLAAVLTGSLIFAGAHAFAQQDDSARGRTSQARRKASRSQGCRQASCPPEPAQAQAPAPTPAPTPEQAQAQPAQGGQPQGPSKVDLIASQPDGKGLRQGSRRPTRRFATRRATLARKPTSRRSWRSPSMTSKATTRKSSVCSCPSV